MSCRHVRAVGLIVLVPAILTLASGCGGSAPKTYPVKGKVVFKDNPGFTGQLSGGAVVFQSTSDPNLKVSGLIDDDDSFGLVTIHEDRALNGAPAGQYKARIQVPKDDERKPARGLIHPKYEDFDKSGLEFTVPTPGDITVEVERPTARKRG